MSELALKGLCQCGCGGRTLLAPRTTTSRGWIKGEPIRFIHRHQVRVRPSQKIPLNDRIWRYVEPEPNSGCWLWVGHITEDGYGAVGEDGTSRLAHRAVYELLVGPIPDGLQLDHLCRVRRCVNPGHLEPVTNAVNCRRGLSARLTEEDAVEIRTLVADGGLRQVDIAARFGIRQTVVSRIALGKSWA